MFDIDNLSLEQKIGQTLCFGWDGETPEEALTLNAHARALVEEMQVGSIVLMGRNVGAPEQTRALLEDLQTLSPMRMFIAIDQEGGSVNRFRPPASPFHEFPGNMALGAISEASRKSGPEKYAYKQAMAQAHELLSVGINWNFAPVVDVNNNPDNPIIGVRSYGEDPELVARFGAAAVRGYQDQMMLACAKHFPGHGDTAVDSHLALPTVTGDRARMNAVELVPFRAVMEAEVGAIMTTHILFPALDGERPATISPAVLTGLLREELGYNGIVITDCLEMEAIAGTIGTPQGAVEALKAGADIVLVCHTLETQRATVTAIRQAVESGELPEERINEAAERVLAAKRRFLTSAWIFDEDPWLDPEHDALEQETARKSITVVRNNGSIPLQSGGEKTVHLMGVHRAITDLGAVLERNHAQTRSSVLDYRLTDAEMEQAFKIAAEAAQRGESLIVATIPPEPWSDQRVTLERQALLVKGLFEAYGKGLIVVALREPYDLRYFPEVENYICTYGYRPCSLKALSDALFGIYEPTGRLPVTIPL
jgi:beta-N-acetylhexosaminidase